VNATPICAAPKCDHPAHNGFLCTTCRNTLTADLRAVPDLLGDLEVTISRQDHIGSDETRHGGSDEHPLPLRIGPMEARRDLHATLISWAWHIATRNGATVTTTWFEPANLARYLAARIYAVDSDPLAGACADEIGYAVVLSRRTVDKPLQHRFAGPCDDCGTDLYALPKADDITCRGCAATYQVDARRDWLLDQAEDRLLTATEMSRALPGLLPPDRQGRPAMLTAAMIRGWAHRGRITQHPAHPARPNEPLYVVGDVLNLFDELHREDLAS